MSISFRLIELDKTLEIIVVASTCLISQNAKENTFLKNVLRAYYQV